MNILTQAGKWVVPTCDETLSSSKETELKQRCHFFYGFLSYDFCVRYTELIDKKYIFLLVYQVYP